MLQWREPALTAILTLKEKKTRFLFEKSSPNVLVSSVGIRIKNYIDFIKLEKFFTTKKRVCGRQKRSAALPRRALSMTQSFTPEISGVIPDHLIPGSFSCSQVQLENLRSPGNNVPRLQNFRTWEHCSQVTAFSFFSNLGTIVPRLPHTTIVFSKYFRLSISHLQAIKFFVRIRNQNIGNLPKKRLFRVE